MEQAKPTAKQAKAQLMSEEEKMAMLQRQYSVILQLLSEIYNILTAGNPVIAAEAQPAISPPTEEKPTISRALPPWEDNEEESVPRAKKPKKKSGASKWFAIAGIMIVLTIYLWYASTHGFVCILNR